jgi:hypothetical protein
VLTPYKIVRNRSSIFKERYNNINTYKYAQHTSFVISCNSEAPAEGLNLFNLEREVFMYYNLSGISTRDY